MEVKVKTKVRRISKKIQDKDPKNWRALTQGLVTKIKKKCDLGRKEMKHRGKILSTKI